MSNSQLFGRFARRNSFAFAAFFLVLVAAMIAFSAGQLGAQNNPRITSVDPASGKANDTVTVAGENLEKSQVAAVFLSDDKDDHKAVVVSQEAGKIVIKIPDVKPGSYNVSIQTANAILIQPVRFTVQ